MTDDLFGDDEDPGYALYEAHRQALMATLSEFADEQEIDEEELAALLLEGAISMAALDYALTTGKPSESGLKMQFDRLQRTFADFIRMAKKDAKNHLARIVKALDETVAERDEDED